MTLTAQLLASLFVTSRAAYRAGTLSREAWRAEQIRLWQSALDEGVLREVLEMVTR